MPRLVAFGCSYTFGHGLRDCLTKEKTTNAPSRLAWPSVLAKLINIECVNLGIPGASNKHIWYKALETDFKQGDVAIFLWTHIERWCILQPSSKVINIGSWGGGDMRECYYKFIQTDYDSNYDLNFRINHIDLYLKSKGIESFHCVAVPFEKNAQNTTNIMNTNFHKIRGQYGLAADGNHPSEQAQECFANALYKELMEETNEITLQ